MVNIIVIGAGVVGLSTAVNIQRVLPGVKVKVVADRFYDEMTSIGAGELFLPSATDIPGISTDTLKRWCESSWHVYSELATSDLADGAGYTVSHGYLFNKTKTETPLFADIVYSYREMLPEKLAQLGVNNNYRFGYEITTIATNTRKHLFWLMKQFTEHGGNLEKRKIGSLRELYGHCDVVVNCCGLDSQKLCGDKLISPLRSQVIRLDYPRVKDWVSIDAMTHTLPSDDFALFGGTRHMDTYLELWPALKGAKVIEGWVGLRPMRGPIRLEKETVRQPQGMLKVVHNYGHGSNGVTLSWGTAVEAAEMVKEFKSGMESSKL